MGRATHFFLTMVVAALVAFAVVGFPSPQRAHMSSEPAFARVVRSKTLRCGFGIWPPGLSRDPLTGQLSGIFFDYLEAIGRHTGLKIVWVGEVGWGDYPTALSSGRIDAMCFGAWPKANLALDVLFTKPIYFLPINAYVRAGDTRFDHALSQADDPSIKISVIDSELSSELARSRFPRAATVSVPQLSDATTLLLNVADGKADITFTDGWTGASYLAKNPGTLRQVPLDHPLRVYGHTIPVAQGENSLVGLLNTATDEIENSGELEAILNKYSTLPGVLQIETKTYH